MNLIEQQIISSRGFWLILLGGGKMHLHLKAHAKSLRTLTLLLSLKGNASRYKAVHHKIKQEVN